MKIKIQSISEATSIPVPRDLTPEELAAVLAEYKKERTPEALEADYQDFEAQVAAGVPAEQLFEELHRDAGQK